MYREIKYLFPDIADSDFSLRDDGGGAYIERWDRPESQPSLEQIANVVVPPEVPQVVSKFQAKAALRGAGLLGQVEQMMADPSADPLAVLAWTEAQEFRRTSPTVLTMGAALGLDDAALDSLFTQASSIEA